MRGFRLILVVLACVGVICAWAPAGALASGCNGSAGDSQYVDPLANCNPPPTSHGGGSGGSTSGPTTTPVTTPPSSNQAATVASSTTTATAGNSAGSSKDPSSGKSLPFTGLDLVPALIVAASLLGSGLALRRLTGDAG